MIQSERTDQLNKIKRRDTLNSALERWRSPALSLYLLSVIYLLGCDSADSPNRGDAESEERAGVVTSGEVSGEASGETGGDLGGEIGGETGGDLGGETGGDPGGEEALPLSVRCEGEATAPITATPGSLLAMLLSGDRAGSIQVSWVEDPLERVIWSDGVIEPQSPLMDPLPTLEIRCLETEALLRSATPDSLGGSLSGRRLVTPPILIAPGVEQFTQEARWQWRRVARASFNGIIYESEREGDELSLPQLELWWWPLRTELTEETPTLENLGEPVRLMIRDPKGRLTGEVEAESDLAMSIDEWGVYALAKRLDTPPERVMKYQAVFGISMGGGGAAQLGVRHPERFDYVGAMGGPSDWIYMVHYVAERLLNGFCQGDLLGSFCGTGPVTQELEQYSDFNHFIYSENGSIFNRDLYIKIFQDVVFALGNPTLYNPESPYLPPQVPASELLRDRSERCATECRGAECPPLEDWVKLSRFYDDQYNPEGEYSVIPFCDGEVSDATPGVWTDGEHDRPVDLFLAVDLNDNGRRDDGEPIIQNLSEPFEDVGCDGVPSTQEEGYDPLYNPDPSGDDFHWLYNPFGTEGDKLFEGSEGDVGLSDVELLPETVRASDRANLETLTTLLEQVACEVGSPGEPYLDHGLDGVALTPQLDEGGFDWGEGNGVFNYNPNKISYIANSQSLWLTRALSIEGGGPRFWIDGGIRDVMNFVVAGMHLSGRLNAVSPRSVVLYEGFESVLGREPFVPNALDDARFDRLGDHVLLRYGNLDATPEEIEAGDGGHVGSDINAMSRLAGGLHWAMRGWRRSMNDEMIPAGSSNSRTIPDFVESEAFGGRYHFVVVTPPGYDDPDNSTRRYPVVYLLHGYGQRARNLTISNIFFNGMMASGVWPATIFVYPDGACSDMTVTACSDGVDNDGDGLIDLEDSRCRNERGRTESEEGDSSPRRCADGVDNDLDGATDLEDPGCVTEEGDDEGECREGTFYLNHAVGVDGVSRGRDYEGAFLDMMDQVSERYRVK